MVYEPPTTVFISSLLTTASPPFFLFFLYFGQLSVEPAVQIAVPIQMRRPGLTAPSTGYALCFLPLPKAGWAAAAGTKDIPSMATETLPVLSTIRCPAAFGAAHVILPFLHVNSNLK